MGNAAVQTWPAPPAEASAAPASRPAPTAVNRLDPPRTHGRYYVLSRLAAAMRAVAADFVAPLRAQTLIDLGCGDMPYRPLLAPLVGNYLGVDLADNPAAQFHLQADGSAPLPDQSADLVMSTQVLEHVADPLGYLAECLRLLAPAGRLILSTHGVWKYHPHPTDYWRWTGSGLRRTIESAGFQILHFQGLLGPAACGLLLMQDAIVAKLPRGLRQFAAAAFQPLLALADKLHTQPERDADGSVYLLVAQKI